MNDKQFEIIKDSFGFITLAIVIGAVLSDSIYIGILAMFICYGTMGWLTIYRNYKNTKDA